MLIESPGELTGIDFNDINKIGITAGASTPDKVIRRLQE